MNRTARVRALLALLGALAAVAVPAQAQNVQRAVGNRIMMTSTTCPAHTFLAAGQFLYVLDYDYLFSVIGTRYGGNGKATFALPDWRGGPVTQCIESGKGEVAANRYLGEVFEASGTCPHGSIAADGRSVGIRDHDGLWSLIGARYGGDGQTHFNLPDLNYGRPFYCVAVVGEWPHQE